MKIFVSKSARAPADPLKKKLVPTRQAELNVAYFREYKNAPKVYIIIPKQKIEDYKTVVDDRITDKIGRIRVIELDSKRPMALRQNLSSTLSEFYIRYWSSTTTQDPDMVIYALEEAGFKINYIDISQAEWKKAQRKAGQLFDEYMKENLAIINLVE